jgi:hypothetical protein
MMGWSFSQTRRTGLLVGALLVAWPLGVRADDACAPDDETCAANYVRPGVHSRLADGLAPGAWIGDAHPLDADGDGREDQLLRIGQRFGRGRWPSDACVAALLRPEGWRLHVLETPAGDAGADRCAVALVVGARRFLVTRDSFGHEEGDGRTFWDNGYTVHEVTPDGRVAPVWSGEARTHRARAALAFQPGADGASIVVSDAGWLQVLRWDAARSRFTAGRWNRPAPHRGASVILHGAGAGVTRYRSGAAAGR